MVDAAQLADVDVKTWMWWERGEREPYVHRYPTIIQDLDYEPWPEPVTFGEKLLAKRSATWFVDKACSPNRGR